MIANRKPELAGQTRGRDWRPHVRARCAGPSHHERSAGMLMLNLRLGPSFSCPAK
jgi:hypothetical protein